MPDIILPNLGLELPDIGSDQDTWGDILNNDLMILDLAVQYDAISKTLGAVDVTLTDAEAASSVINLNGILTANVNLIVPSSPVRLYLIKNNTTGSFSVTVKTAMGLGVSVVQGTNTLVYVDSLNVVFVNSGASTNASNVNVTTSADNVNYPFVLAPDQITGQKALLMDSSGGTYNPSTNTADLNITGTSVNVSGGTASVTSLSVTNNSTLGDAGTDVTTLNSQLSTDGSVGVLGQVLTSRGANLSPIWAAVEGGLQQKDIGFLLINAGII